MLQDYVSLIFTNLFYRWTDKNCGLLGHFLVYRCKYNINNVNITRKYQEEAVLLGT